MQSVMQPWTDESDPFGSLAVQSTVAPALGDNTIGNPYDNISSPPKASAEMDTVPASNPYNSFPVVGNLSSPARPSAGELAPPSAISNPMEAFGAMTMSNNCTAEPMPKDVGIMSAPTIGVPTLEIPSSPGSNFNPSHAYDQSKVFGAPIGTDPGAPSMTGTPSINAPTMDVSSANPFLMSPVGGQSSNVSTPARSDFGSFPIMGAPTMNVPATNTLSMQSTDAPFSNVFSPPRSGEYAPMAPSMAPPMAPSGPPSLAMIPNSGTADSWAIGTQPIVSNSLNNNMVQNVNPYVQDGAAIVPVQPTADPWATPASQQLVPCYNQTAAPLGINAIPMQQQQQMQQHLQPQEQQQQLQSQQQQAASTDADDDFWASMGISGATNDASSAEQQQMIVSSPLELNEHNLPTGGETYSTRISTRSLGVIFFQGSDLQQSLFNRVTPDTLMAVASRPVVAHVFENSAAQTAGINMGTILLRVNGEPVYTRDEAITAIQSAPRPYSIECYDIAKCEHLPITRHEGMHMVKYDTPEKIAPRSKSEWKPKYVVVGGVIALPHQLNMYRSKHEYDIAVRETMKGADKYSVKVKHFSLIGANFVTTLQMPMKVEYKGKASSYIVIIPYKGYPIKIAGKDDEMIKCVQEGVQNIISLEKQAERQEEEYLNQQCNDEYGMTPQHNPYGVTGYDSDRSGPSWADPTRPTLSPLSPNNF